MNRHYQYCCNYFEQVLFFDYLDLKIEVEDSNLYVKEIWVDEGRTLKRIQAAPHGRAFHIRKRSNHVTIIVDSRIANEE